LYLKSLQYKNPPTIDNFLKINYNRQKKLFWGILKLLNVLKKDIGLSGNALKIIAAATMLIDHIGFILLPEITILRIIGRIAFPIFAFMIAEGCHYTKNKIKYFLMIFLLGVICQTALYLAKGPEKLNVLLSFSIAIIAIYSLQYMKDCLFSSEIQIAKKCFSVLIFIFIITGIYFLTKAIRIDYGFWGCLTPVSVSLLKKPAKNTFKTLEKLDNTILHLVLLSLFLIFMGLKYRGIQMYALFAIPFLLLYSGKRGSLNMKYFFYIFYPVHLLILEGISYLF
jgi:hypothetical protein